MSAMFDPVALQAEVERLRGELVALYEKLEQQREAVRETTAQILEKRRELLMAGPTLRKRLRQFITIDDVLTAIRDGASTYDDISTALAADKLRLSKLVKQLVAEGRVIREGSGRNKTTFSLAPEPVICPATAPDGTDEPAEADSAAAA